MEDLLIETLEKLGYPVRLQGSLAADEAYPASFFTYWNDASDGSGFYSNDETAIVWEYSVNFYSAYPRLVNSKLLEAKELLKKEGFIISGAGYSVMSDEPTHTGRGMDVTYRQNCNISDK